MKFLGIDYGAKAVGLAVSNEEGTIAFPKGELRNDDNFRNALLQLLEKENIKQVVLGDTRALNKEPNAITPEAEDLARYLGEHGIQTKFGWEAWSSQEAARYAPKGKKHDNSAAAAIILQRYLDVRGQIW
jgi:putative Holliday junction resolvase